MKTPIRTLAGGGAALIAAFALAFDSSPTLAQDDGAPCSYGTEHVCMVVRICHQTGFKFQLWPFQFGWTHCNGWEERTLYYKPAPDEPEQPSGSEPDDPGTPPGG